MTECPDSVSDVIGGQATTLPVGVRLVERHRCFVSFELGHLGVSISAVSRRFLPAFVSSGVAAVFLVVLVVVPRRGARACMESSPVQCRIAEIVHSGLAITGVVLITSVASIFLTVAISLLSTISNVQPKRWASATNSMSYAGCWCLAANDRPEQPAHGRGQIHLPKLCCRGINQWCHDDRVAQSALASAICWQFHCAKVSVPALVAPVQVRQLSRQPPALAKRCWLPQKYPKPLACR